MHAGHAGGRAHVHDPPATVAHLGKPAACRAWKRADRLCSDHKPRRPWHLRGTGDHVSRRPTLGVVDQDVGRPEFLSTFTNGAVTASGSVTSHAYATARSRPC